MEFTRRGSTFGIAALTGMDTYAIEINNRSKLTLKDSSDVGTGKLVAMQEDSNGVFIYEDDFVMNSGTIEARSLGVMLQKEKKRNFKMLGGTVKSNNTGVYMKKDNIFDMYGGSIYGVLLGVDNVEGASRWYQKYIWKRFLTRPKTIIINGGTIVGNIERPCADNRVFEASIISGDQETKYYTIEEALNNVKDGDTIKLLQDIMITKTISIDKNITLDLNDHKLTSPKADSNLENVYAITVAENAEFTLENAQIITNQDSVDNKGSFKMTSGTLHVDSSQAVWNYNECEINGGTIEADSEGIINYGGKLTLNDGTITAQKNAISNNNLQTLKATVEINGGTLKGAINAIENNEGIVVVNGGSRESNIKGDVTISEYTTQMWGDSQNNQLLETSNFLATNSADNFNLDDLATTKNLSTDLATTSQIFAD